MNSAHWALQPHLKLAGELKRNKSANSLKAFSRFKMLVSLLLWSEMNSGKFGPVGSPKEFVDQLVSFLHTFSTQRFTVNREFCLTKPFVGLRLFLRPCDKLIVISNNATKAEASYLQYDKIQYFDFAIYSVSNLTKSFCEG